VVSGLKGTISIGLEEGVVALVRWVKNMKEAACELFLRELDVEIDGSWLKGVENTMLK
jgi:hypothetical protein